ncbi:MAG: type 4a pilus biogenesis protein PilO [Xanthomonadaceae bacterium]|nr:type 4a pilus biogenesis protein PilO [Xanthomonadaceae bacterium]
MIDRLVKQEISPGMLYLFLVSMVLLASLASYLYLYKKPLAEYERLKQSHLILQRKTGNKLKVQAEIERLTREIKDIQQKLHGDTPALSANALVAYAIEKIDLISDQHKVQFVSVKPGTSKQVSRFEEVPFVIQVAGDYVNLYEWLYDLEKKLGPMVVKEYELKSDTRTKKLSMELEMVSYRPLENN